MRLFGDSCSRYVDTGAANSLFEVLEEPTGNIHFILLTEQLSKVLITIQSRCQIIRFQSDAGENIVSMLKERGFQTQRRNYCLN